MDTAKHTPAECGCRISGPLGVAAVLNAKPFVHRTLEDGIYAVAPCPTHAAAPRIADEHARMKALLRTYLDHAERRSSHSCCDDVTDNARAILREIER